MTPIPSEQSAQTISETPAISAEPGAAPIASASTCIWVVLGLAVMTQTAGSIVSQGVYTLVPVWKAVFGLSQAAAALVVTVLNGGQIISMIGLGRATDHYGERAVVSVTMIGMGLVAIATAMFASSYTVLLCFIGVLGMLYASVQPGGTRAILRWFPAHHRGLATGFRQAAVPLGTSIAALILPALAASSGWRTAVLVQGAVGIAGGAFFWLFYREDADDIAAGRKIARLPFRKLIGLLGEDRAFWPVVLAGVAMSAFQFTFTASAISFMADHFRIGLVLSASLFAATQVVGIPGRVLLPYLSDRLWPGRRERSLGWIMAICTASMICYALLPVGTPRWALYSILVMVGFFGIGWFPIYILQIAEIAPKTAIASTVGFASTLCMIAMSLGPLVFGMIVDFSGYRVAWGLLILPVALLAVPLLRLPRRSLK